ncbi:MAG: hypothetical protein ACXACD_20320 [Candidatus Thorarchaeota archaeon]
MSILLLDLTSPEEIPLIMKPLVFLLEFSRFTQNLIDAGAHRKALPIPSIYT